jgi:hypothetical protein
LRARHYDLVVHLSVHTRGAWLVRLLRPRWSVAPKFRGFWAQPLTCIRHSTRIDTRSIPTRQPFGITPTEPTSASSGAGGRGAGRELKHATA